MSASSSERRTLTVPLVIKPETRSGQKKLVGHGAVFNSASETLDFGREIIQPGAFKRLLAKDPDVFLYWMHDSSQPLARTSAGNLKVYEDSRGLAFEATPSDTQTARDALTLINDGVIRQMSFGFRIARAATRGRRGTENGSERSTRLATSTKSRS
jgi:uncharacterized protein